MCCARDLRIFAADFFEHALPQAAGVSHGVGLVAHQNFVARRAVEFGVLLAIFEGVADDALDAFARVDVFLRGDFIGRSLLENAAGIGVDALRIFAEHDEVHVFGLDSLQRTQRGIEQAHGSNVGVEIHFKAHAEQNLFGMDVGLHPGIAESADQNGVEIAAQHGKAVGRNRGLVAQVAVGAPIEFGQLDMRHRSPE